MPKIIDYSTPQRGVNYAEQRPDVIATGQEGRGLEQLGAGIQNFAMGVGDAIQKRQLQKDHLAGDVGAAGIRDSITTDIDDGIRTGNLDPQDISNKITEKFNTLSESIETRQGKDALTRHQAELRSQMMEHAIHSKSLLDGKEAVAQTDQFWVSQGNSLQKNPTDFKNVMDAQTVFINNLKDNLGLSTEKAKELTLHGNSEMAQQAVRGIINVNAYQAKKTLNSGVFDDYLKPDDRSTLMNQAQTKIDAAEAKIKNIESYRVKDPYKFLQEHGIAPPPIDLMKQDSIVNRVNFIEENKQKFGYFKGEIPILTPLEARDFGRMFDKMPSNDASVLLQNISINMPENLFSSFSKQIFNERKSLGVAMAHSRDDLVTSEKIIAGQQLLHDPKGKAIGSLNQPSMAKLKEVFNARVGNSIQDSGTSEAFLDAAIAHYAKSTFDKNGDFAHIDESAFSDSIKSVMGPIGSVNGSNIVSFRGDDGKFVDAGDLEHEFNNIDSDILKKTQGDVPRLLNKEPVDISKTNGRFTPVSVGDGRYLLKRDQELLLDKDGNPYELNMKSYFKESQKNKGNGFMGAISGFFKRVVDKPVFKGK